MKIKEISWIIVLLVFCTNNTFAQVKFGIATGITPSHIDPGEIIISNIDDSIKYSITSTSANWQVGTFLRFQAGNFYVRGSVLANFGSVNYDKDNLKNTGISTLNARDHTINCDIPIEVGFQIKDRFLVHAGLHWSDFFRPEEESLLKNLPENFIDIFNDSQIGYTGGIGFDINWQVTLGINYTYFSGVKSSIVIDNNVNYNFDYRKHYIMVNATWNFIKKGWD
ncbi:MAG: outer membrane protein [Saprospiraceae bacterium]